MKNRLVAFATNLSKKACNECYKPILNQQGNPYIRVFEEVADKCKKVVNTENEYEGYVTIAYENIHVFNKEKNHYDTLDYVETTYYIWYKFID